MLTDLYDLYVGTYHEDGKEPVIFSVSSQEYSPNDIPGLRSLLKQSKRNGYWTIDR